MKKFIALSLSGVVFIMLINVKIPTIVGILTFMSRINFLLRLVEHGKKFYNLEPGLTFNKFIYEVFRLFKWTSIQHKIKQACMCIQ